MKAAFLILTLLILTVHGLNAHGDFVPGRVRVSADGVLDTEKSSGIYRSVKKIKLTEFVTDGQGITHYDLLVNGQRQEFRVIRESAEECSVIRMAEAVSGPGDTRLILQDSPRGLCPGDPLPPWSAHIRNLKEGDYSTLRVSGVPERFLLSQ